MCRSLLPDCKPKVIPITNRQEDDKLVLYGGHHLFVMGNYAAEIWNMCDGEHKICDIVEIVINKHGIRREKATTEITEFINRLAEKHLITL